MTTQKEAAANDLCEGRKINPPQFSLQRKSSWFRDKFKSESALSNANGDLLQAALFLNFGQAKPRKVIRASYEVREILRRD